LQWRRFNFFDKELLKDGSGNEAFDKLQVKYLTRNMWQSLAYSPLGVAVSPPSEYL